MAEKLETRKPPEFEFKGEKYRFEDLSVGQIEAVSEILHESRRKLLDDEVNKNDGNNLLQAMRISVNVAEIVHDIKRQKKYARFVAACMLPKGQEFSEKLLDESEEKFKALPDKYGSEVVRFFFTGEEFAKMLIPDFLQGHPASPESSTRSGK